ncbi:ankyrin repeat-containing domain protein [Xylaria scruposa]|nr:ankyrin repeat-containing domain protein [Xylaria scruposa]
MSPQSDAGMKGRISLKKTYESHLFPSFPPVLSTPSTMASNDWERHKATILHLYLLEKSPLHQIVTYMQQEHDFTKKKSQYEYQFKKWGVKKNLKKEDWQHLRHQLQKRQGKQSEVTLFGIPLSKGRIRKETLRYTAIPSASEFGKQPSSPQLPGEIMLRTQTPPIVENITWPALPWFRFKNIILPMLRNPSGLLNMLFAVLGPEEDFSWYEGEGASVSSLKTSKNPLELRKALIRLTSMIPDDSMDGYLEAETLAQKQLSLSMATELLKAVFFRLSNNDVPYGEPRKLRAHDQLILHLVGAVSRSNPEVLSYIFSSHCATANAIKEAVYGSAIRKKDYAIVLRLLDSGVDPNLEIHNPQRFGCTVKRGIIEFNYELFSFQWSGICQAAFTCDTRLCRILINAGASVNNGCTGTISALEIAAFAGGYADMSDKSVEFAQLLLEYGALTDNSPSCRKCTRLKLLLPIAISVIRQNNRMAEFLTEKDASIRSYEYTEVSRRGCDYYRLGTIPFKYFGICRTPLNTAIVLSNKIIVERLLQPVLSHTGPKCVRFIKETLITSILVGDADTASKLLVHHPGLLATDRWTPGVKPLVATAWNKDITIAERLLGQGAHIGPKRGDGILQVETPAPIHMAAYYGNTDLVRRLIYRGADYNVRYQPLLLGPRGPFFDISLSWLLPVAAANPLQLALWNGSGDTVSLLVSQDAGMLSEKSIQGVDLSDIVSITKLPFGLTTVLSPNQNARAAFQATEEIDSAFSAIQSYFSLGGLYRSDDLYLAVLAAIESKDYSIVRLIADHRPIGEIDSHEASSLMISIEEREWSIISLLLRDPFLPGPSQSYYQLVHDEGLRYNEEEGLNHNRGYPDCRGHGLAPLGWAMRSKIDSVIENMIQRGYKLQNEDMPILMGDILSDAGVVASALHPPENMDLSCRQALLCCSIGSGDIQKIQKCIGLVDSLNFESRFCDIHGNDISDIPLERAIETGNVQIVRLLLEAGADAEFGPVGSQTALHIATEAKHFDIVKCLLDRGAKVEPPRRLGRGMTALQYSAREGHFRIAKLLISRGADINTLPAKYFGRTALEVAAEHGKLDMVQFLLEMGAKLDGEMRIYYVRSVGLAMRYGHYAIANFLKENGSWGERDQVLYDRPGSLMDDIHFRYDEELDDWHIRKIRKREGGSEFSVGSSDSNFYLSDDGSDTSDVGIGEQYDVEENDEVSDDTNNTNRIPQAWWDGIDLAIAYPCSHAFTDGQALGHGLALCQDTTNRTITELDETLEDSDAKEISTDQSAVNQGDDATIDYHASDRLDITVEQEIIIREEDPDLGIHNYTPGTNFATEQLVSLNTAEIKWEGPFSNSREIDDINEAFGVSPFRL